MLATLLSIFTSSGAGGILGVVGSWLTKREERKNLQLTFEHEIKMSDIRKQEVELEMNHELAMVDKQVERAQAEGEIQKDIGEIEAFKESLKEQSKSYGVKIVDSVRGLMRPLITIYLLVIATYITIKIGIYVGGFKEVFDINEMIAMYKETISQIMFLVTTAVTWWFGSRPSSKRK